MMDNYIGPSNLHLKKELTALGKSRGLRDPDTRMSWKSPLSSAHLDMTLTLNSENENVENKKGMNNSSGSVELPSGYDKRRKKVYLYNWRHHESKSSDSGFQLDLDNKQTSLQDNSSEQNMYNTNLDSRVNACLEDPLVTTDVKGKKPGIPVRKTARKSSKGVSLRNKSRKSKSVTKMLDLASNSSGYSSSEELQILKHKSTQNNGSCSHCGSPILYRPGCGNWSNSTKLLKSARRECSSVSCTPASNSSNNRLLSSASFNGNEVDQLDNNSQICGIPCNLPKRTRDPCSRSCTSASLSDTPRRMVRSILCGSRTVHPKRRSSSSRHQNFVPKSSQDVPLLTNNFDGIGSSADSVSDELASNFGELDLEAVSRLDGRRWSSCGSHERLELGLSEVFHSHSVEEKCLSQKYKPMSFDEIVGQNIVVQSLSNAVLKGRIAPGYLFQGPRGVGKTSVARVFAAALNCLSKEENRPCGLCSECINLNSGIRSIMKEVDATDKKAIKKLRLLLKKMPTGTKFSRCNVIVIDECHTLSSNSWSAFMKFLEEPLSRVIFIFITVDPNSLPSAVMSRCQKYVFPKIKETDIAFRVRKISAEENLDAEWDALDLIASNSDGSLRDAETMLGQLSLLGKRITTSLVNDLVGVVSSESLLDLLITALSSDTVETVKKSRELMESGIDPVALMSQLASLIMDVIAGTSRLPKAQSSSIVLFGESLTEAETERLQRALKILSGAEKQLRLSSERATWFTAALLQIGSSHSPQPTPSCSSSQPSIKRLDLVPLQKIGETSSSDYKSNPSLRLWESSSASVPGNASVHSSISASRILSDTAYRDDVTSVVNPDKLDAIWRRCIEKCDSERLRHLLHTHGKLVSVTETRGILIAYIAFSDSNIKSRAERFLRSITNSIALVLKHNVEVRMGLLPEKYLKSLKSFPDSPFSKKSQCVEPDRIHASYDMARRSVDKPRRSQDTIDSREQRGKKTFIDEQRLESAWLQAAENSEAALARNSTESKQKKNHNLVQDGTTSLNAIKSLTDLSISFKHWKDGDGDEIEELENDGSKSCHQRQAGGRIERYHHAISPSLLHSNSFRAKVDRESVGYESGPVQSGLCCWRTHKSNRVKGNQGDDTRSQPAGLCFGNC